MDKPLYNDDWVKDFNNSLSRMGEFNLEKRRQDSENRRFDVTSKLSRDTLNLEEAKQKFAFDTNSEQVLFSVQKEHADTLANVNQKKSDLEFALADPKYNEDQKRIIKRELASLPLKIEEQNSRTKSALEQLKMSRPDLESKIGELYNSLGMATKPASDRIVLNTATESKADGIYSGSFASKQGIIPVFNMFALKQYKKDTNPVVINNPLRDLSNYLKSTKLEEIKF